MKILFKLIISGVMLLSSANAVYAKTDTPEDAYMYFTSEYTAEDALKYIYDGDMHYGDVQITRDAIETGLAYACAMEQGNSSSNGVSLLSTGDEIWTIQSSQTVVAYGVLKGKYLKKVAAGVTAGSSSSASITLNGTFNGYNLSASATYSHSVTYNGPAGTESIGTTGLKATHRYYSIILSGSIVKYTYRVTDQDTGAFLRTETAYLVANGSANTYSNLGNLNASTGKLNVRSASTNSTKSLSESTWISYVNSSSAWSYVGF